MDSVVNTECFVDWVVIIFLFFVFSLLLVEGSGERGGRKEIPCLEKAEL